MISLICDVGLYSLRFRAGLELAALPAILLAVNGSDLYALVASSGWRHRWSFFLQLLVAASGVIGTIYFPVLTLRGSLEWLPGLGEMGVLGLTIAFAVAFSGLLMVFLMTWNLFGRDSRPATDPQSPQGD